jgi:hypothetical protein
MSASCWHSAFLDRHTLPAGCACILESHAFAGALGIFATVRWSREGFLGQLGAELTAESLAT